MARRRRKTEPKTLQIDLEWIKHLEVDQATLIAKLAEMVADDIEVSARGEGRSGKGGALPALDREYAKRKLSEGRAPIPDLNRTGHLWSTFGILKTDGVTAEVGFDVKLPDDIKKIRRLTRQRRNPLGQTKSDMKRHGERLVKKGILKEVPGAPKKNRG